MLPFKSNVLFSPYRVENPPENGATSLLVIMLMTPASASLPQRADDGPFTISICSTFRTETRDRSSVPAVRPLNHPALEVQGFSDGLKSYSRIKSESSPSSLLLWCSRYA